MRSQTRQNRPHGLPSSLGTFWLAVSRACLKQFAGKPGRGRNGQISVMSDNALVSTGVHSIPPGPEEYSVR
jgi:hypothetical protein